MASMSDGIQRMDRSDPESVSDPCMSSLGDQSEKAWSLRGCEGTIGRPDAPQRIKMCGPKSVLPSKAATVASQWLELLQLDIKGRLLALQRSKKRVRNVIQTELPYISSSEFSSNLENDPSCGQSSGTGCSIRANSDTHVARWMSLFSRMDENLNDEANKLESSLREVQESRMLCEMGLQFSSADCSSQLGSSEDSRGPRKRDAERAVMAAAASIYSTCNLVLTKENMPCF